METPYEYYNGKLGVRVRYLIFDRDKAENSLCVISYKALNQRCNSKNCAETQLRRASLNYEALIEYNSLCRAWKDSLTVVFGSPKQEIKKSWFAQNYEADRKAFEFYCAYRFGDDNRKLDTKLVEEYTYNASVLNTVIKIKENRKNYMRALGATNINIWESLSADVNSFREVAHTLPSSSRGLRMKYNEYLSCGYSALISGKLTNKNASKLNADERQKALIDELLSKHTNLGNELVATLYNTVAEKMDWPTITAQTVASRKKESNLVIYAGRHGSSALSNNILMQNKRTRPTGSMLFWSIDGWDAELLYQKSTMSKSGSSVTTYHNRLTMVVVLDPFNNYPVGYAIGTHENPELIKSAIRNAYKHVQELFGDFYRPYQLQTDNYSIKSLKPAYEVASQIFTPARVKNSKAKPIEPYFRRINDDYCKLFDNWSGYNVNSGSSNQPNSEYLNKIRHSFPDEHGCRMQLVSIIEAERAKKQDDFKSAFNNVETQFKSVIELPMFLKFLGESTQFTNRMQHDGLRVTINGAPKWYDCFDINFRKKIDQDWAIFYNPDDLTQVLAVNAKSRSGKLVEVVGTYEFLLTEKYMQPMAIADRSEGDTKQLQLVSGFNKSVEEYITDTRVANAEKMESLFSLPQLDDTLAKHLLVDSRGQHKDIKSSNRLSQKQKFIEVQPEPEADYTNEILEYNKSKVNLNDYI
ncbi:MAG: hypothetical protein JST78_09710 [Bacteroidetes bacterium]|nr:hypothetical protein [Bacteroidota bacterium]